MITAALFLAGAAVAGALFWFGKPEAGAAVLAVWCVALIVLLLTGVVPS